MNKWQEDDPLATPRGIANGMLLSFVIYLLLVIIGLAGAVLWR